MDAPSTSAAVTAKTRHVVTWSAQEDDLLREQIALHGTNNWTKISANFNDKTSRQCRRRWCAYLDSEAKKGGWSAEEDMLLCEVQKILGNRWTDIAKVLTGRTDNAVKNRFSVLCKKRAKDETFNKENNVPCVRDRLISAGIDVSSLPANKQPLVEVSQNAGYSTESSINGLSHGIRLFGKNIQPLMNRAEMSDGSGMQPQKQQQQQQYNTLSGQVGRGMQSVPMNQKHSSQGFGDGMMNNNNGVRLFGRNIQQLMNGPGPGMSEGHMGIGGTYGNSTKPLQQGFSSRQIQQRMPTSQSQQGVSLMGDNTVDMTMSSCGNYYNPAGLSNMSSTSNLNKISAVAASLQSKPNPSMLTSNHQAGIQQIQQAIQQTIQQPIVRSEPFSHQSEGVRAPGPTVTTTVVPNEGSSQLSQRETWYQNQLNLLLFLLHAKYCTSPDGHCPNKNCVKAKPLLEHIETCYLKQCRFYLCMSARKVLLHIRNCQEVKCPVCMPARKFIITAKQKSLTLKSDSNKGLNGKEVDNKVETEAPVALPASASASLALKHSLKGINQLDSSPGVFSDNMDVEPLPKRRRMDMDMDISSTGTSLLVENEERNDENATEAQEEMEEKGANKSGKPKIKAVSMIQFFTPEQVREHIKSLGQWVGQSKSEAVSMNENSCQLCGVEKLTFKPPPIYCTPCGVRIKRNTMYYHPVGTDQQRHYICIPCFNDASSETIEIEGHVFPKRGLEKKRNDEKKTEEEWVQCDKCEAWQHQICALFNECMNDDDQAEYTCPNCYIEEVEIGERKPLPQSAMLGAKDLPRTILSDHIENRLFKRLKQERQDRANHFGKSFDEVPGAEELVVRVVSSVDKKLEVKPRFLEIFQQENYPTEFPYKSKAILLFQKIEGVEVCLFAMYMQQFGTECASPNHRRVYLSYLDSVKYFTPQIRTVSGEALRTFVYHEILIGYLEYVKRRGFTSCYIWACPPLKGEDYILYCHPEIQKTPKSNALREWYLSLLKKGVKENIVVELTNLYDHFFTNEGESRAKVTATRLPYFDGDYWPGAAEHMITQLCQEENDLKLQKKKTRKASDVSKDTMLMNKLGKRIYPKRGDLILVHLQHPCNHCCTLMVSGTRWVCNTCPYFNLCNKCHKAQQLREFRERHPTLSREKHTFRPVEISGVASDTTDGDDILESESFDTRQAFLSLCQGKHYQFDTLRRAKHSSMMLLYHLHLHLHLHGSQRQLL
ncbi:histone acetyltransferase HAC1-like isoform X2 [Carex littledalei]|uniref:histone acetyltransferase n=1 Tax=Carex littledalei TaxID=544730 RepID=A0A833VIT6_9POAL|nr:histone acetyltransferase HAC1-like isoform X2 [Carex littledalei]